MRDWYEIRAKAGSDSAEVLIYGDIGESWWADESITAKNLAEQLSEIEAERITVRINSFGGAVSDGLAIYNALRRHPADITTTNDGVAMSIASLIWMAGDVREVSENALTMIHAPWGATVGNAQDLREMADTLDKFAEAMISAYRPSGLPDDEIRALLTDGKDHFYTATEAVDMGFATAITAAIPVAANYFAHNRFTARREPPKPPEENIMAGKSGNTDQAPDPVATAPAVPDVASIEAAAQAKERDRIKARAGEIRQMFGKFVRNQGVQALMDEMLDDTAIPMDQVSAKLLAKLGESAEPLASTPRISMGETANEKWNIAAAAALQARCGLSKHDPQNHLNGRKLLDLARESLEIKGTSTRGMGQLDIAEAALKWSGKRARSQIGVFASGIGQTTSDFDVVLENTMHKALLAAWGNTPDVWSRICKIGSVSDFRAWNRLMPGSIGDIDTVTEGGEYLNKTIPDAVKESITVKRRGNIVAVTPEVLANDDLSYFSDVPAMFGRAAKRTIETAFFSLLTSASGAGPTLNETSAALFSSTHGNLTTSGAVPSVTTIDVGRQTLASQKDPSSNEYLGLTPAIWLGPLSLGGTVRVINNSQYDPDTANKLQRGNMVYGIFRDIIDTPRLTGNPWYMFADPAVSPVFEVVFLDGVQEPQMSQETEFRTSGLSWKVELPFGVGCIGWRGAYQNDGA